MKEVFDKLYRSRRNSVCAFMKEQNIAAALFEDSEMQRSPAVRYLTGHPMDALLVLLDSGKSVLVPWDENLAKEKAHADETVPSEQFGRSYARAAAEILGSGNGRTVCVSPEIPFCQFRDYSGRLEGWTVCADEHKAHSFVQELRAVKDSYEIECTRKAASITDEMTELIIAKVRSGEIQTEADAALFAERELRLLGAERTSFDTLAAGPERSFAIHAFPGYTNRAWACEGISILDYGVCYEGYASDCTVTIAKGHLSREQNELLDLVQEAADECVKLYRPNEKILNAVRKADEIFARANRKMPHGLGHGTGLEIHENPFVSMRAGENDVFKAGNIITLEPGLYNKELGGVRLENDVLITEDANEVLTHSRIFRL